MDWQNFSTCFTGSQGQQLMSASIKRTRQAGIGVHPSTHYHSNSISPLSMLTDFDEF
jgi:hypothetical protein